MISSSYPLTDKTENELKKIEAFIPEQFPTPSPWFPKDTVQEEKPNCSRALRAHEFLYLNPDKRLGYTRLQADLLLYQAILELTENRILARMYWYGVRCYGKEAWKYQNMKNVAACCAKLFHHSSADRQNELKMKIDEDGHLHVQHKEVWPYAFGIGIFAAATALCASKLARTS